MRYLGEPSTQTKQDQITSSSFNYGSCDIANLKLSENILERLASKAPRKIYTDKTNIIYNKSVEDATGRKALDTAAGKRMPELKPNNVMATMIIFREK